MRNIIISGGANGLGLEKQKTFMNPSDTAKLIVNNVFSDMNLTVSDIVIERNV